MVSLGRAVLRLEADSSRFNAGLDAAERRARATSRAIAYAMIGIGTAITGSLALSAREAIRFESSFAGIRKTVDATATEFARLSRQMRDMALRIPINVNELNRIGELGGQLGVQAEHLARFTETIARLGVATNITATQAAQDLAQFINVMGVGTDRAEEFASVLVELGNNTATTESAILNISKRIAAFGVQVGLTHDQVQAYGATLLESGVRPEAGGTAFGRTITMLAKAVDEAGENLTKFANISRMTADEFATLWGDDANAALLAFIRGIRDMREAGGDTLTSLNTESRDLVTALEDLQIGSVRQRQSLFALSNNYEGLIENLRIANIQTERQDALLIESNKRFATSESQLILLQNSFREAAIVLGEAFLPAVVAVAQTLATAVKAVANFLNENRGLTQFLVQMFGVGGVALVALGALKLALLALGPAFATATAAGLGFFTAMRAAVFANPWVLAITGIVAAITLLAFNWGSIKDAVLGANRELESLANVLDENRFAAHGLADSADALRQRLDGVAEATSEAAKQQERFADAVERTQKGADVMRQLAQEHGITGPAVDAIIERLAGDMSDPFVPSGELGWLNRYENWQAALLANPDFRNMPQFHRQITAESRFTGAPFTRFSEEKFAVWFQQELDYQRRARFQAAAQEYMSELYEERHRINPPQYNYRPGAAYYDDPTDDDYTSHSQWEWAQGERRRRRAAEVQRLRYQMAMAQLEAQWGRAAASREYFRTAGEGARALPGGLGADIDLGDDIGTLGAGQAAYRQMLEGNAEAQKQKQEQFEDFQAEVGKLDSVTLADMNAALGTTADSWRALWEEVDDGGLLLTTAANLQAATDKLKSQEEQIDRVVFRVSDAGEAMREMGGSAQILEDWSEQLNIPMKELALTLRDAYGNTSFLTNEFDLMQAAISAGLGPELLKLIGLYQELKAAEDALREKPGRIDIDRNAQWQLAWAAGHGKIDPTSYVIGERDGKLFVETREFRISHLLH